MAGLPNTQVFLDDGTGTFSKEVTKYARLADGYQFSRGRADTQSAVTAGLLSLTFINKTGAFTPGSTYLGSPSLIKLDTPIRIKETVNGVTYNRYTGFVKSWAVGWPDGTEDTSVVHITASDSQARAERRVLRSVIDEEFTKVGPTAHYTFGEPTTASSAADTSGNQAPPCTQVGTGAAVAFGTATTGLTDGLTGATFTAGGKWLQTSSSSLGSTPGLLFGFKTSSAASMTLAQTSSLIAERILVAINAGAVTVNGITVGTGLADGNPHIIGIRMTAATTADLYLDGVLAVAGAALGFGMFGYLIYVGGAGSGTDLLVGTAAHLTLFAAAPTGPQMISMSQALLTGFAGESGTARITRTAGYANISIGTLDSSLTNVPFVDTADQTAWSVIQDVCDAEMGVAYVNGSGAVDFHNRQRVIAKTTPDLTLSSSFVTFDAEPTTDDQDLLNYFETSSSVTGVAQVVRSTTSETSHGRYSDSKAYLLSTDQEALDRGNWLIKTRAEPASSGRYGTLTVNLYAMTAVQQSATIAALESGCWLRVVSMPTQTTGGTTVDVVVEGIAPVQNSSGWQITCNVVSKAALYPRAFLLDSSVLDGPDLLGV